MRAILTFFVVVIAVVFVVLLIGAYTIVPAFLGRQVASVVKNELSLTKDPQVTLTSSPAPNVYRGDFSGGTVAISDENFGTFRMESVDVDLDPFDVDVMQSISASRPVLENGDVTGDLRAVVPGEQIVEVVWDVVPSESEVELQGDELIVRRSEPVFAGIEVPVEIRGGLSLRDGQMSFNPTSVSVAGEEAPAGVAQQLASGNDFSFALEGVPPQMTLNDARIEDGNLVLEGRVGGFFE